MLMGEGNVLLFTFLPVSSPFGGKRGAELMLSEGKRAAAAFTGWERLLIFSSEFEPSP